MNSAARLIILTLPALMLSGCFSTTGELQDYPLSATQQKRILSRSKPPQQFGFSVYAIDQGVAYSGRGRLHPNHFTAADMLEENIPVIRIRGRSQRNTLDALIDISSPVSWMEFSVSQDFDANFMASEDQTFPYRGDYNTGGVAAYAALVTQLRIDNLFIENIPFYVRMSTGSLGPLARGIREPHIDAIIGYDNLQEFEYIQYDLRDNTIRFSASTPYLPADTSDEAAEAARIVRVPGHGLAVEGSLDGQSMPIILDFAGDFNLARGDTKVAATRELSFGDHAFENVPTLLLPIHNVPPRVGRKLLSAYLVTICNKEGIVYFEKYPAEE